MGIALDNTRGHENAWCKLGDRPKPAVPHRKRRLSELDAGNAAGARHTLQRHPNVAALWCGEGQGKRAKVVTKKCQRTRGQNNAPWPVLRQLSAQVNLASSGHAVQGQRLQWGALHRLTRGPVGVNARHDGCWRVTLHLQATGIGPGRVRGEQLVLERAGLSSAWARLHRRRSSACWEWQPGLDATHLAPLDANFADVGAGQLLQGSSMAAGARMARVGAGSGPGGCLPVAQGCTTTVPHTMPGSKFAPAGPHLGKRQVVQRQLQG